MSGPNLLNRNHRLDQLSLQCDVSNDKRFLQVNLTRDAKLDGLASDCQYPLSVSGIASGGKGSGRLRKRRRLANSFEPDVSLLATTPHRSKLTWPSASEQDGSENPSVLDSKGAQPEAHITSQHSWTSTSIQGSVLITSDRSRQSLVDHNSCELPTSANESLMRSNTHIAGVTKEDFMTLHWLSPYHVAARLRKCTHHRASKYLHTKSRMLWEKICREVNNRFPIPDIEIVQRPCYVLLERSSFIDRLALQPIPQQISLKSLKGSSAAAIHRNPHSLSVLLERDPDLDKLALEKWNNMCSSSSNSPQAITDTCEPVLVGKGSRGRKGLRRPRTRRKLAESFKPEISLLGTTLGRRTLILSGASKQDGGEKPVTSDNRNTQDEARSRSKHLLKTSGCKCLSVMINRDSSLDMLALQTSNSISSNFPRVISSDTNTVSRVSEKPGLKNLSIKIKRDVSIDQLALKNSSASVTDSSDCDGIAADHQPTLEPPSDVGSSIFALTKSHGEGMGNSSKHNCLDKMRSLPIFKTQNYPESPGSRNAIIKLRRISSGDWSIIQPSVEQNRNPNDCLIEPKSSNAIRFSSETPGSKNSTSEPTDSGNANVEFTKTTCINRISLPTANSSRSEENETRSHDILSSANLSLFPTLPQQQNPVFLSSAKKSFEGMVLRSKSSKRAKSAPSSEEAPQDLHHNENKNPRKRAISPVKTVGTRWKSSSNDTVRPRGLRKNNLCVVQNRSPKEPSTCMCGRFREPICCFNSARPSISHYMSVKKPLAVKSEFQSTLNTSQVGAFQDNK